MSIKVQNKGPVATPTAAHSHKLSKDQQFALAQWVDGQFEIASPKTLKGPPKSFAGFQKFTADPKSGQTGDVYFNAKTGQALLHASDAWFDMGKVPSEVTKPPPQLTTGQQFALAQWVDGQFEIASPKTLAGPPPEIAQGFQKFTADPKSGQTGDIYFKPSTRQTYLNASGAWFDMGVASSSATAAAAAKPTSWVK